jgi:hypothetical protein
MNYRKSNPLTEEGTPIPPWGGVKNVTEYFAVRIKQLITIIT